MSEDNKEKKWSWSDLWYRLWDHKDEQEKKRLKSFIPLILYAAAVMYGVLYLSVLNSVNRYNTGPTVKHWWGGDRPEVVAAKKKEKQEMEESFTHLRKRVSGGR